MAQPTGKTTASTEQAPPGEHGIPPFDSKHCAKMVNSQHALRDSLTPFGELANVGQRNRLTVVHSFR